MDQIRSLPGVRSASAVSYLPFDGMPAATGVEIGGRPKARSGEALVATIRTVMPGYFQTMGIPIRRGRDFTAADNTAQAPYRFVVNEAFVHLYLAGQPPLEQRISADMGSENPF